MTKEEKLKIVERLVNEKAISFTEGLSLMETEKEYIFQPTISYPNYPVYPWYGKDIIICGDISTDKTPFYGSDKGVPFTYTN